MIGLKSDLWNDNYYSTRIRQHIFYLFFCFVHLSWWFQVLFCLTMLNKLMEVVLHHYDLPYLT